MLGGGEKVQGDIPQIVPCKVDTDGKVPRPPPGMPACPITLMHTPYVEIDINLLALH